MDLTKIEIALLTNLMRGDGWDLVLRLLARRVDDLQGMEITGQDAFQTLRALHLRDGGVKELKQFFDDMERRAFAK